MKLLGVFLGLYLAVCGVISGSSIQPFIIERGFLAPDSLDIADEHRGLAAVFQNPAGLAAMPYTKLKVDHVQLFDDVNEVSVSYVMPLGHGLGFGIGYSLASVSGIPNVSDTSVPTVQGNLSQQSHLVTMSLGMPIWGYLNGGIRVRGFFEDFVGDSGRFFTLDAGIVYDVNSFSSVGLYATNLLGSSIHRTNLQSDSVDTDVVLEGRLFNEWGSARVMMSVLNRYRLGISADVLGIAKSLGGEFNAPQSPAQGYGIQVIGDIVYQDNDFLRYGYGVQLDLAQLSFQFMRLDYVSSNFEDQNMFGLMYQF